MEPTLLFAHYHKMKPSPKMGVYRALTSEISDDTISLPDSPDAGTPQKDAPPPVLYREYCEPKRCITVAYQLYEFGKSPKKGKNMKFAASIFRFSDPSDASGYKAHDHRMTALARLQSRPNWCEYGIASFLRRQIHERGVRAGCDRPKQHW